MAHEGNKQGKWTETEDEMLRSAMNEFGERKWKLVSSRVPGRSPIQCLHRWTKILKPGLVKGAWSVEEDSRLRQWVEVHGPQNWSLCAKTVLGRSGKQCRERWYNILSPGVKIGEWRIDEDATIFYMFQQIGPKWTIIAKCLEGRTENSIKNRFYSLLRKSKIFESNSLSAGVEKTQDKDIIFGLRTSSVINQIMNFHFLSENRVQRLAWNQSIFNEYKNFVDLQLTNENFNNNFMIFE